MGNKGWAKVKDHLPTAVCYKSDLLEQINEHASLRELFSQAGKGLKIFLGISGCVEFNNCHNVSLHYNRQFVCN